MKFATHDVEVPAGKAFSLDFNNKDGAPHNVAIYTDASAVDEPVPRRDLLERDQGRRRSRRSPPGTYFFRCDVHPDMQGTITAK